MEWYRCHIGREHTINLEKPGVPLIGVLITLQNKSIIMINYIFKIKYIFGHTKMNNLSQS